MQEYRIYRGQIGGDVKIDFAGKGYDSDVMAFLILEQNLRYIIAGNETIFPEVEKYHT